MKIPKLNLEKIVLILIGASFFIGIWHALPMLNVIGDEMYYVGGVLRAMEHHTIVPLANDVPYGTLTYIANYVLTGFVVLIMLPFFGFGALSLKLFLIQSPSIMYLFLRILSAFFSIIMLVFINKILKKEVEDLKTRLFLLILLFTNIITVVILHTGKMWVLSTLLVLLSFYYLYKSLESDGGSERKVLQKNIFLSIIFAFLALSNFPLNLYSLICLPIMFFYWRGDKALLKKIILYTFAGGLTYIMVTLFNFEGIKNQIISIFVIYHPLDGEVLQSSAPNLNFIQSFFVYILKLLNLFPLLILTLFISIKDKIKNKKLFVISIIYFGVYFFLISFVANWTGDLRSSLRYLFPLGFFLVFIISSFGPRFRKIFYAIGFVSVFFGCLTLYYLSVPTTYNEAYNWVNKSLSTKNTIIINEVSYLQLIKNKQSSLLTQEKFCGSKCQDIITYDLNNDFKPEVWDPISKEYSISNTKEDIYYIKDSPTNDSSLQLVASFTNPSSVYHSVDYNMGNYFDLSYLRLKNLGEDEFIYKKSR